MPLFGKPKSPRDLVIGLNESFVALSNSSKNTKEQKKLIEEISRLLTNLRELLVDKSDTRLSGKERDAELSNSERARIDAIISDVTRELINLNLLPLALDYLDSIEFESAKHFAYLFGCIMRRQIGPYNLLAKYLSSNISILITMLQGYLKSYAIFYGSMLRDACRDEAVAKALLWQPEFPKIFGYIGFLHFDVMLDLFSTLKDVLTRHKATVAEFLNANYDQFFPRFHTMIESQNYVTKRQALKLLGELLLDRNNVAVMTRYISDPGFMKLIMNALKETGLHISFEAFNIFKIFVANPNKPECIHLILYCNQEKLITFLENFQTDRTDDGQFNDEKKYLIKQISELKPPNTSKNSSTSHSGNKNASKL